MAYALILKQKAKKGLSSLNEQDRTRIRVVLRAICNDPFSGKKLEGDLKDYYSVRVPPYRIVYEIYKKELIIIVIRIGHRQGVYK